MIRLAADAQAVVGRSPSVHLVSQWSLRMFVQPGLSVPAWTLTSRLISKIASAHGILTGIVVVRTWLSRHRHHEGGTSWRVELRLRSSPLAEKAADQPQWSLIFSCVFSAPWGQRICAVGCRKKSSYCSSDSTFVA